MVPRFITRLQTKQQPIVYGDGEQSRDFTYVDNAVQANLLAVETDAMSGGYFNCACGSQFTLNQLLDKLRAIIGVDIKAQYDPPRQGDIKHSFAAIDKLQKFGYKPTVGFEDGLKKTVEFFTTHPIA